VSCSAEQLLRISCEHFDQDGAPANITKNSLLTVQNVFDEHVIGRGLWPSLSPDLNMCPIFVCGET
jgi:hypothetical protein